MAVWEFPSLGESKSNKHKLGLSHLWFWLLLLRWNLLVGCPKWSLALVGWSIEIRVRRISCRARAQSRIRLATPAAGTNTTSRGLRVVSLCRGSGLPVSSLNCQWLPGNVGWGEARALSFTWARQWPLALLFLCCDVGILAWSWGTINILVEPGAEYSRNLTIHLKDKVIGRRTYWTEKEKIRCSRWMLSVFGVMRVLKETAWRNILQIKIPCLSRVHLVVCGF